MKESSPKGCSACWPAGRVTCSWGGGSCTPPAVLQLGPAPPGALPVPCQLPALPPGRGHGGPCPLGGSPMLVPPADTLTWGRTEPRGANGLQPCAEVPATGRAPWPSPPALGHPWACRPVPGPGCVWPGPLGGQSVTEQCCGHPRPGASAEWQQLGPSAAGHVRAHVLASPQGSTEVTPGLLLADSPGQSPRELEEAAASPRPRTLWRKSRCPVLLGGGSPTAWAP